MTEDYTTKSGFVQSLGHDFRPLDKPHGGTATVDPRGLNGQGTAMFIVTTAGRSQMEAVSGN